MGGEVKYRDSLVDGDTPAGYPTLGQLRAMLGTGGEDRVLGVLDRLTSGYVPCRTRLRYMEGIRGLLADRIRDNSRESEQV